MDAYDIIKAMTKRKENKILEDNGDWLVVDISTKTHPTASMEIDKVDYELLQSMEIGRCYAWRGRGDTVYARAKNSSGSVVRIHRAIRPDCAVVDHLDGCGTHNRGLNLRNCTQQQNTFNGKLRCTNISGCAGVQQLPSGTWEARIGHNYKIVIIGYYKEKSDAIEARRSKELELFGEYSSIHRGK